MNQAMQGISPQDVERLARESQQLAAALSAEKMDLDSFVRATMDVFNATALLSACSGESILRALIDVAKMGFEPSMEADGCYLMPTWDPSVMGSNGRSGAYVCRTMVGYRALISVAVSSGAVESVDAEVVREGDLAEFRAVKGTAQVLSHVISVDPDRPRGNPIAFWAKAVLPNAEPRFVVVSLEEMDAFADRFGGHVWSKLMECRLCGGRRKHMVGDVESTCQACSGTGCVEDLHGFIAMSLKTCIRRVLSLVPIRNRKLRLALASDPALRPNPDSGGAPPPAAPAAQPSRSADLMASVERKAAAARSQS